MTLLLAIKHKNGVILASDSRATIGDSLMRNEERKFEILGNKTATIFAGMAGLGNKTLSELRKWFEASHSPPLKDVVEKCEDLVWEVHQKYEERFDEEDKVEFPSFLIATHKRIFKVHDNGYAEEVVNYACDGSGLTCGEYVLSQRFKPNMTENEVKHLATYTILQTSKIDPNVGGKVILISLKSEGIEEVKEEEIDRIVTDIEGFEITPRETSQQIVEEIAKNRRWINARFKEKFGFELFEQNEFAILGIQKPCRNENEFTDRVATLALLIDRLEVSALDKVIGKHPPGSINALETFLDEKYPSFDKKIITNFREIMILRSKKMPIHKDDPKIIQVLLKWGHKIPPDWSDLWIEALQKYKESLLSLKKNLA